MIHENLVEAVVEKVIPEKLYKVVRCITRVWEFPDYVSCVKEASVISKSRNKIQTKWRIEVNKVPITWIAHDVIEIKKGLITFKAVEGDLETFGGQWEFKDHPEGTLVKITAYAKVGVPGISGFAEGFIRDLLGKTFEAILAGIEKQLIEQRYNGGKGDRPDKIGGFGVIGHFYNFYHLEKCLKMLNPTYKMPSREFLSKLFHITPSFKMYDAPEFTSKAGAKTHGCFILATFIPDMIEHDMWGIFSKVVKACKIAERYGVGIVTLGGFTSIIAERIGHEISKEVHVPVTTGNTFTAAMVLEGIYKAVDQLGVDLSKTKVAIVGGTGDIGSACARVLVDQVKQLTLTGRTKRNLKLLNKELSSKKKAKVITTTENEKTVKEADIIIAAASVSASILKMEWFKPGAIICDVGYPKNISYSPKIRKDILIFSGGLTKPPSIVDFPIDTGLPSNEIMYGCFAEAIILSLEKRYENYSFGRGNISAEKIKEIRDMGVKHGFEVAPFYWGDILIDGDLISEIKESVSV